MDFDIFQRKNSLFQEFVSNMAGQRKGKIRWFLETFVFSDHLAGFLCLNLNTVRFQGVSFLKVSPRHHLVNSLSGIQLHMFVLVTVKRRVPCLQSTIYFFSFNSDHRVTPPVSR